MNRRWLTVSALVLAAALGVLALRHLVFTLSHPWPVEYGEGVNLLWARAAAEGTPLYPDVSPDAFPQIHNPYPPLYPLLASRLQGLGGGRLISLAGLALAALAMWKLLRRRVTPSAAGWGLAVFLLSPAVLRYGAMMRVDALALGLSLSAFALLDRRRSAPAFALAALLSTAAILTKPTYAAAAGTVLVLLCRTPSPRARAGAALGVLAPLAAMGLWLFSRETPELGLHLWTLQRLPSDPAGALQWAGRFANSHALWFAGGLAALSRLKRDPLLIYGLLAALPPLVTLWTSGSGEHYLLELWAVACLAAPGLWERIRSADPRVAHALLIAQFCLLLPLKSPPLFTRTYGQELSAAQTDSLTPTAADREIGKLLFEELRTVEGPVLSCDPALTLLAGHPLHFQPYQFPRLAQTQAWNLDLLHQWIDQTRFSHILLKGDAATQADPYLSPDTQTRIETRYELHRVIGPWHLYRR